MSETWTEYCIRVPRGILAGRYRRRDEVDETASDLRQRGWDAIVVGRTVTASDWLPVDTDGAA